MGQYKVEHYLDPFELAGEDPYSFKRADREEILQRVSDFVVESILEHCADEKSPVSGKAWKKLSEKYAAHKKAEGLGTDANLLFTGDMLNSLTAKPIVSKNEVKIWLDDPEQEGKAYGHNTGFEGHPTIKNGPKRQFIPTEDDTFHSRSLVDGIKEILKDYDNADQSKG
jgi:hypothetical protein